MLAPAVAVALQVAAAVPSLDQTVRQGIERGVYPGAVVVVGRHDTVLVVRGYGHLTWSPSSAVPDPDSTLYDLASLTKVVATLPAIMVLVEEGTLQLDRPVRDYLPDFQGSGKDRVTVRHLLAHTSGLPAYRPFYRQAADAGAMRRLVMAEPLKYPAGGRVEYSDLNGILLGWVVEAVTGQRLDQFVRERVFLPAGMQQTGFRPPRAARYRIAPVGLWRGRPVAGEVHDQNAARLGGVSGHAGLFATGMDLARYAQLWLGEGRIGCSTLFRKETVAAFRQPAARGRALGWELRDAATSDNTGTQLSQAAFGHTGFTGTSLWIDPERDVFVVLLTNRVYAPRMRRSISQLKALRGKVADAAVALLKTLPPRKAASSRPAC